MMEGNVLLEQSLFADEPTARATFSVSDETVIHIGGIAPQSVPVAVLPTEGRSVPAVTQDAPPDALGGWARLRIAGVLAGRDGWDGVVVDTGSHSNHWVHVSADEIVSFQGAVTPRLITALSGAPEADGKAANATLSRPERLSLHLHTAHLSGDARAVSGHLMGAEIASMKPYWLGQDVIVLSQDTVVADLLHRQGSMPTILDPDEMLVRGLCVLAQRLDLALPG